MDTGVKSVLPLEQTEFSMLTKLLKEEKVGKIYKEVAQAASISQFSPPMGLQKHTVNLKTQVGIM